MRDLLQLKVIRKGFFGKKWLQKTNEGYKWWQHRALHYTINWKRLKKVLNAQKRANEQSKSLSKTPRTTQAPASRPHFDLKGREHFNCRLKSYSNLTRAHWWEEIKAVNERRKLLNQEPIANPVGWIVAKYVHKRFERIKENDRRCDTLRFQSCVEDARDHLIRAYGTRPTESLVLYHAKKLSAARKAWGQTQKADAEAIRQRLEKNALAVAVTTQEEDDDYSAWFRKTQAARALSAQQSLIA